MKWDSFGCLDWIEVKILRELLGEEHRTTKITKMDFANEFCYIHAMGGAHSKRGVHIQWGVKSLEASTSHFVSEKPPDFLPPTVVKRGVYVVGGGGDAIVELRARYIIAAAQLEKNCT